MTTAGDLRESVHLQVRSQETDELGNVIGDFATQFTIPARIKVLKGGEEVMAGRLASVQTAVITGRYQPALAAITTDWRAVDARRGTIFNIRSITPTARGDFIDLLCQSGVAT